MTENNTIVLSEQAIELDNPEVQIIIAVCSKLLDVTKEYLAVCEMNKTERQRINATLKSYLEQMKTERTNFEQCVMFHFKDRAILYENLFAAIRKAMDNKQPELVDSFLKHIEKIYSENPFAGVPQTLANHKSLSVPSFLLEDED